MAATTPRFDRMAPAAPDNVGALRRELRRWALRQGASPAVQANIALAFSEACTSILGPDPPREGLDGPLILQAWREHDGDGGEIGVQVSHGSRGAPPPRAGVGSGFGLAIMAMVCDRFEVRRRDERPGTAMLMTFRLDPAPERSSPRRPSRSTIRR
jgi:hypothetical protein